MELGQEPETVGFECNICGERCLVAIDQLQREAEHKGEPWPGHRFGDAFHASGYGVANPGFVLVSAVAFAD